MCALHSSLYFVISCAAEVALLFGTKIPPPIIPHFVETAESAFLHALFTGVFFNTCAAGAPKTRTSHRRRVSDRLVGRGWRESQSREKNEDGKRFACEAFVLGFATLDSARDVVRGFCATFATKSGKEKRATWSPERKNRKDSENRKDRNSCPSCHSCHSRHSCHSCPPLFTGIEKDTRE